jgi:hypothetical protein
MAVCLRKAKSPLLEIDFSFCGKRFSVLRRLILMSYIVDL